MRLPKLDVVDTYRQGTLQPSQVGSFTCIVPSSVDYDCIIIYINTELTIGWVDTPNLFCALLKILTEMANTIIKILLLVPWYNATVNIPNTYLVPPHTLDNLTNMYWYMYDVIKVVWCGPKWYLQVFDGTSWALKWLFPYFTQKTNDLVSIKKLLEG